MEKVDRLDDDLVPPHGTTAAVEVGADGPDVYEPGRKALNSVARPNLRAYRKNRIIAHSPDEKEAAAFRILRTQIRHRMEQRNANVLGVCSACDGEGKSVIAINLAMALAGDAGRPVLLVDMDLRRPAVSRYMGIKPHKGLDDFLLNEADIGECLVNPGIEGLAVLPTRKPVTFSSDLLSSQRMSNLIRNLRDVYTNGIVICDLPPLLLADDYLAFSGHVDACLFIVENGRSKRSELERALSLVGDEKLIGTVLNRASKSDTHYYYGYY